MDAELKSLRIDRSKKHLEPSRCSTAGAGGTDFSLCVARALACSSGGFSRRVT